MQYRWSRNLSVRNREWWHPRSALWALTQRIEYAPARWRSRLIAVWSETEIVPFPLPPLAVETETVPPSAWPPPEPAEEPLPSNIASAAVAQPEPSPEWRARRDPWEYRQSDAQAWKGDMFGRSPPRQPPKRNPAAPNDQSMAVAYRKAARGE